MKSHFRRHQETKQKISLIWEESIPQYRREASQSPLKTVQPLLQRAREGVIEWKSKSPDWFIDRIRMSDFAEIPDKERLHLCAQWLREALFENQSGEIWTSMMLELRSLEAPLSLVKGASRAYLDEIEHARLGFSMVRALSPENTVFLRDPSLSREQEASGLLTMNGEVLFQLSLKALVQGVWVQEMASRFSIQLSRERMYSPIVAELLKKSVDEHRHSDLYWDIFSWSMGNLGVDSVSRLWSYWSNLAKPKFEDVMVGEGRAREVAREVRADLGERLKSYFLQGWRWQENAHTNSERALPISRPAS